MRTEVVETAKKAPRLPGPGELFRHRTSGGVYLGTSKKVGDEVFGPSTGPSGQVPVYGIRLENGAMTAYFIYEPEDFELLEPADGEPLKLRVKQE